MPEPTETLPLSLLVSPLARGAWFAEHMDVALAELRAHFPEADASARALHGMRFVDVDLPADALWSVARLSWLQGAFERCPKGLLRPLRLDRTLALPAEFVDGAKYRGKTNEMMTRLAIELGLRFANVDAKHLPKLLDPVAGRGTTLLWAARLGIEARGIERDGAALDDFERHVKRQTKLHRIKHRFARGFVGRKNREGRGRFAHVEFAVSGIKLIAGDSAEAAGLLGGEKFTMVVGDLPYGVQHVERGGTRNPLENIRACAPAWARCLRPGGALVLIFNSLQPRRAALAQVFADEGLVEQPWRAPHRMSESIVRDVLVMTRPR